MFGFAGALMKRPNRRYPQARIPRTDSIALIVKKESTYFFLMRQRKNRMLFIIFDPIQFHDIIALFLRLLKNLKLELTP